MRVSAGILMYRHGSAGVEVLLVHPGGPFFRRRDLGAWSIPKGEVATDGEDLVNRARLEFEEELGFSCPGDLAPLGFVRQKGGKTVHAWALRGDFPDAFDLRSNTFSMEWPPHSGQVQEFPEVDRAEFFPIETAKSKIIGGQRVFLERLLSAVPTP